MFACDTGFGPAESAAPPVDERSISESTPGRALRPTTNTVMDSTAATTKIKSDQRWKKLNSTAPIASVMAALQHTHTHNSNAALN